MKCSICQNGETSPGSTTSTMERKGRVVVIRDVPAEVCRNCGHAFTSVDTTAQVFAMAEALLAGGAEVSIRAYAAA